MKKRFEKGTTVTVKMTYTDEVSGALTNPAGGVTVRVRNPDGVITNPAPTNPSAGVFQVDVDGTVEGTWYVRFTAANPNKVDTVTFDIYQSPDF